MAQIFEKHLVENGFMTPEQALRSFEERRCARPMLGKLALSRKMLTMKQIFAVLSAQSGTTRRFGETAVDLGYLKPEDVVALLKLQREWTPSVVDLLVAQGVASKKVLSAELDLHLRIKQKDFAAVMAG